MNALAPFRVQAVDYPQAMAELHAIRETVFVREQHVPGELERDAFDASSLHVVARTLSGEAIGTGRLVPPSPDQPAKIGRMAVLQGWRNRGVGAALLLTLLRLARQRGWYEVALNAQVGALDFYLQHGFVPRGARFHEAGIEHQAMHRLLAGPFAVATQDDAVATSVAVVQAARRGLCLFLRELDPGLFDAPPLLEALRRYATAGIGGQARVLLQDALPPQRAQAPLLSLAQRMPSIFLFREVADAVDREYPSAFLANDVGGYYFRRAARSLEGEADLNAPGRARQLRALFESAWQRSRPVTEYRALGI
ncbi:MAG: GNAT family N-acetyltransferase [Pseudomonadota bacterium]|nr:GNAT family N-acetyltransferase [Pseudomonadota bacterium]